MDELRRAAKKVPPLVARPSSPNPPPSDFFKSPSFKKKYFFLSGQATKKKTVFAASLIHCNGKRILGKNAKNLVAKMNVVMDVEKSAIFHLIV